MTGTLAILVFIALYGISINGGQNGKRLFLSGIIVHSGYVLYRWIHLGWMPVTERHDILLVMALLVAFSFFYFQKKASDRMLLDVLPLFVIFLSFFGLFQVRFDTIDPNMNSGWFSMYIIFFLLGYAFFTVSTVSGVMYIRGKWSLFEMIQYRTALFGWLLFSLSLVGGSVWFYLAYGSYWLWTAKELWITIVWFYYSFYLHTRMMRSLSGTPSTIIGLCGFPVIIFAYLGVMPILGSPWSQF